MKIPENSSNRGDPGIMFGRQSGAVLFRIYPHAPEFTYFKRLSAKSQPVLEIEYRAAVVQLHTQRNDQHQRR